MLLGKPPGFGEDGHGPLGEVQLLHWIVSPCFTVVAKVKMLIRLRR